MRRVSSVLLIGWTILIVAATPVLWWVGVEERNLINLVSLVLLAPIMAAVWLVGAVPLTVLWIIESRPRRPPTYVTFPGDRSDEPRAG